ncbi:hypothetical protein ABB37_03747 [Leptomonas pyrrhocoris]|uniref:Uncharacterized protein n=1 Tax=Leptomonas pyrrhocoris TaxID=157538 RepID=A0A0M9G3A1_LEPPY|nr:hypothetical protein ABB37_03747 [Leptomonas pyrrhocoris]KPA81363.1 hypothetical protein ABB37_03747 [Leptomonas pyrrhocoris]|eukprot:XP_015659802.1 hypothetical protein ABB37_03747 [Leptomonas pyrrhocoris]
METAGFTCASHDLEALQRRAAATYTSLDTRQRYYTVAELSQYQAQERKRKVVQNLGLEALGATPESDDLQNFSREPSTSTPSRNHACLSSVCGGCICATQHTGSSCFPSLSYRASLAEVCHTEGLALRGTLPPSPRINDGSEDAVLDAPGLLWSLVPQHLLMPLIQTPHDAERMLARLQEEERLLRQHAW